MTYHARPNPTTAGTTTGLRYTFGSSAEPAPQPAPVQPSTEPAIDAANPTNAARGIEPSGADGGRVPANTPDETAGDDQAPPLTAGGERPWYRQESWLAVELAAFLPMVAALFAPVQLRVPLVGLGGLLVVVGLAMLIRQGLPPAHARPRDTLARAVDGTGDLPETR